MYNMYTCTNPSRRWYARGFGIPQNTLPEPRSSAVRFQSVAVQIPTSIRAISDCLLNLANVVICLYHKSPERCWMLILYRFE